MWWRRRKRPAFEADGSDAALRVQLVEASAKLRGQIQRQDSVRFSRGGGYGGDDLAVQLLQTELDQIEEALAELDRRSG
ncbi:MAG: hypothetical protein ACTHJR_03975 [Sphingomonas sp.]